jgi:GNAT superfamily N-acetyltransferase
LTGREGLLARLLPEAQSGRADEGAEARGYRLREAWQRGDAALESDAIAFWNALRILPSDVRPQDRAQELVALAYRDDRLVGVSTAAIGQIDSLRGRFAVYRCAVHPEHRRQGVATALTIRSRAIIGQWAARHREARLLGLACVISSPELTSLLDQPCWPATGLDLVGFTPQGRQVRVAWFDEARLA